MNDVWSAVAEKNFFEQTRCEGVGVAVREGDNEDSFGEAINDS